MSVNADVFAAQMAELRRKYLAQLPAVLAMLDVMLLPFSNGTADADNRESLRIEAHKLAGSGGTFDCPDISTTARALEHALLANASLSDIELLGRDLLQACLNAQRLNFNQC